MTVELGYSFNKTKKNENKSEIENEIMITRIFLQKKLNETRLRKINSEKKIYRDFSEPQVSVGQCNTEIAL